jgi:hypothetical protein
MPIRIRPVDLESDRTALIEMMRRSLTVNSNHSRFQWLYRQGAYGQARAWVAIEEGGSEIVGLAAAFPRLVSFDGKETRGFVLGDFCMNERYRSLGPALQLQRACMSAIDEGPFEFLYDFPSKSMTAIYTRLGIQPAEQLVRWAKPLRTQEKLERALGSTRIARVIAPIADFALARRGRNTNENVCDLKVHGEPCGIEFTELDEQIRRGGAVRTSRSAEYLNWRYFSHPICRHQMLTARRAGKLIGYVVYTAHEGDSSIVDLNSTDDPDVIAKLLQGAVEQLRALGAATVNLHAGSKHPWNASFERAGFLRRDSADVIAYVRKGAAFSSESFQRNWFVMHGDRDS